MCYLITSYVSRRRQKRGPAYYLVDFDVIWQWRSRCSNPIYRVSDTSKSISKGDASENNCAIQSMVRGKTGRYAHIVFCWMVGAKWYPFSLIYFSLQVGGWTQVYGKTQLSFASIRGASHTAPSTQPARSFSLFKALLAGKPLPNACTYPNHE